MEFKSPLIKRQKLTKTTFNDVRDELNQVTLLRKNTTDIIDDVLSAEATERIKFLSRIQVDYTPTNTPAIPDVDDTLQSLKTVLKRNDEMIRKHRSHIILLDMLEQKRQCPIAQIIDEI